MEHNNIIGLEDRRMMARRDEEEGVTVSCIVCPYCKGVEWAINIDEKTASVEHLICVSEECDGDTYIEVEGGVVSDEVMHHDYDAPE